MTCLKTAFLLILVSAAILPATAQQNLFNVPSGTITREGELFFQQQFNLGSHAGTSNTTTGYGLGNGWEAGINLFDITMYDHTKGADSSPPGDSQVSMDVMFNVQKGFDITEWWSVGLGAQTGINPSRSQNRIHFQNFSWAVNSFEIPGHEEFGRWYAGASYSNNHYGGAGNRFGPMFGVEIPVIEHRLAFQADALLGTNALSVIVIGGVYTFRNDWQLSLGWQLPAPGSSNYSGVVVEFTYPGWPLWPRHR